MLNSSRGVTSLAWLLGLALLFTLPHPASTQKANSWEIVGTTGVAAQQIFATADKVYLVDKVENNPSRINGHPAWAAEYDVASNTIRLLDIVTNSFCAGGTLLGNGTWLNAGGNAAVTVGGIGVPQDQLHRNPYLNLDGGRAARLLTPCSDNSCNWLDDNANAMPLSRWYPTVETLPDGDAVIIGGELYGSFVNTPQGLQNVPTIEFFPVRGEPVEIQFLVDTMPANLYPLTWLVADGRLFMQAGWATTLLNYTSLEEQRLPNITHAQRTYPASGSSALLPLTVANNYTATFLFCGGLAPERDDWNQNLWQIAETPTSTSCVRIDPLDSNPTWDDDDDLPEPRGMGSFIILPDGRLWLGNGVGRGSAGYGWDSWAVNQSYAQDPVLRPLIYNPSAPAGSRWDTSLPPSTIPRMYHSTATLLADGSLFVAGSNPNVDVIDDSNNGTYLFKTEYRAERFYPSYFDAPRPTPHNIPSSIAYGGMYFNLSLPARDDSPDDVKVVLIRTGFQTHAMSMGMKYLELAHTATHEVDSTITLHVLPLPPNPSLFAPGPALLFVVVDGVPSIGQTVMVGSGQLGVQPTAPSAELPPSLNLSPTSTTGKNTDPDSSVNHGDSRASGSDSSSAIALAPSLAGTTIAVVLLLVLA